MLQLVQIQRRSDSAAAGGVEEWGEFLHVPGKRFYDFSEIRREIQVVWLLNYSGQFFDWLHLFSGPVGSCITPILFVFFFALVV